MDSYSFSTFFDLFEDCISILPFQLNGIWFPTSEFVRFALAYMSMSSNKLLWVPPTTSLSHLPPLIKSRKNSAPKRYGFYQNFFHLHKID